MGHQNTAYADERLSQEIASLRLFPSQAREPGNIYDVLECQSFRRTCSGSGEVAQFVPGHSHCHAVQPNADASAFLSETLESFGGDRLWIKFS